MVKHFTRIRGWAADRQPLITAILVLTIAVGILILISILR
jgi:hypothetical protein